MQRIRFVNGDLSDFLTNIKLAERAALVRQSQNSNDYFTCVDISISDASREAAEKMLNPGDTARYSGMDPESMVHDAMGRLTTIPTTAVARAVTLCKMERFGGAQIERYTIDGDPNHDVVIVEGKRGFTVFVRSYQGREAGNCYTCNNAEAGGWKKKAHKCFRRYTFDSWLPELYVNCTQLDTAEDVAGEVRSAYAAESEQETEGYGSELPFSNEYLAGYVAARPQALVGMQD